jgi:hypothetical protein
MPQFGGKDSKRHFTVVMGGKEHGLYVSSTPSSAARKAVSKLCATDKKRKVSFHIREITQKSEKKTYGPYLGYIEKLAKPIELKGRVIRYKPVAKLSGKSGKKTDVKKGGMRGGGNYSKELYFTNETTMNYIKRKLEEYFGDTITTSTYSYQNRNTGKTVYYINIQSQFMNPTRFQLNDFKELIDKKLQEILTKEPNIFTNKGWNYITNGTTNNNINS